jgi:hypothetical protein
MTAEQLVAYSRALLQLLPWAGLLLGLAFVVSSEVVRSRRDRVPLQVIGVLLTGLSLGALVALLVG